jgi:hypothetical protein
MPKAVESAVYRGPATRDGHVGSVCGDMVWVFACESWISPLFTPPDPRLCGACVCGVSPLSEVSRRSKPDLGRPCLCPRRCVPSIGAVSVAQDKTPLYHRSKGHMFDSVDDEGKTYGRRIDCTSMALARL